MSCLKQQGFADKKMEQSTYTFIWRIPDFHKICPENCTKFSAQKSPIFSAGDINFKPLRWFVHLKGVDGKIASYLTLIMVDLANVKEEHRSVKCAFKFGFGNKKEPYHISNTTEGMAKVFGKEGSSWGYAAMTTVVDLYKDKKDMVLQDNTLQVTVQLKIFGDTVSVNSPMTSLTSSPSSYLVSIQNRVCADYRSLFLSKKFSDVEIICAGTSFHCHRSILQARSKVFDAMFESGLTESSNNQVYIDDMEPGTFSSLLEYIYTGHVELEENGNWSDLIYGAEKYDLIELKNYCFEKLFETTTDENIGMLAVTAYTYNPDEKLKDAIKKYCQTHMGRLMENAAFRKLLVKHPGAFYDDLDSDNNSNSPNRPSSSASS